MTTKLIEMVENQRYESPTGTWVMEREKAHPHYWILKLDGSFIERDKYRTDLAERHGLTFRD